MTDAIAEKPNETRQTQGEALEQPRLNDSPAKAERQKSDKPWLWSKEQALAFSEKGRLAKIAKAAATKKALEEAEQLKAQLIESSTLSADERYRLERLRITREQLEKLDEALEAASDEKGTKAICDAIARLSEVERQLAGRPSPGSHRPSSKPAKRSTPESYGPVE